jgi:hypothetical protein
MRDLPSIKSSPRGINETEKLLIMNEKLIVFYRL